MLALIVSATRSLLNKVRALRAHGHTGCDKRILQISMLEISSGMVRTEDKIDDGAAMNKSGIDQLGQLDAGCTRTHKRHDAFEYTKQPLSRRLCRW